MKQTKANNNPNLAGNDNQQESNEITDFSLIVDIPQKTNVPAPGQSAKPTNQSKRQGGAKIASDQ
jgi:hypothetical protein